MAGRQLETCAGGGEMGLSECAPARPLSSTGMNSRCPRGGCMRWAIICIQLAHKARLSVHNGFESCHDRRRDSFRILDHFHLCGVNSISIGDDLEEEMRSGGTARRSYQANCLTLFHELPLLDQYSTEMAVPAFIAVFVTNTYIKAISVSTTLECHPAICNCIYGGACGGAVIHAGVHFPITENRMNAITVAGSDAKSVERGPQIIPLKFYSFLVIIFSVE